jgi:putative transposase
MTVSPTDRREARSSYPTDLNDAEWHQIVPHLPDENLRGRPRKRPIREILDAIFYVVRGGCAWRLLLTSAVGHRILLVSPMAS